MPVNRLSIVNFLKKILTFFFLLYGYEGFVCMRICALYACSACPGQKRVLDPLELEIVMDVSHHMGTGNWTQIFWKYSQRS